MDILLISGLVLAISIVALYILTCPKHPVHPKKPSHIDGLSDQGYAVVIDGRNLSDKEAGEKYRYVMDFAVEIYNFIYTSGFDGESLRDGYKNRDNKSYENFHMPIPKSISDLKEDYPLQFSIVDFVSGNSVQIDSIRTEDGVIVNLGSSSANPGSFPKGATLNLYTTFFKDNNNQINAVIADSSKKIFQDLS